MISVSDALKTIFENTPSVAVESLVLEKTAGRILAEDIVSDIAMPPFDRSAMDGFAIRGVCNEYQLMDEIPAGVEPRPIQQDGIAAAIMTGAKVPEGADRVVMVEVTSVTGDRLTIKKMPVEGANICWKAEDITRGQTVLAKGTLITPAEIGIAAMAGREILPVYRRPVVSVLTTGSEVIPPVHIPRSGQVRNANGVLIFSFLTQAGFSPVKVFHSADDPESLRNAAAQALSVSDILVTAGGVSMGTHDYVPSVLEDIGFKFHFRTVAQKPGKPFSFATNPDNGKMMFGLPGNPVSVLVGLEMYVLACLRLFSGHVRYQRKELTGRLTDSLKKKPGRLNFFRTIAALTDEGWTLRIPATSGSGDLMSTRGTNSIAWLPPESIGAEAGTSVPFTLMSWAGGESFWE
ncbi:MAG: molybdopterin molybdotransferase MoeA [Candidatus Sabulitectum sp.]|nr:molybdopterin molybdotransferase MoeA [Candidatus Sabulitectum sp.]